MAFLYKTLLFSFCSIFILSTQALSQEFSANKIIEENIKVSTNITNIYTNFKQEKFLPNFDAPLKTEGILFFDKTKPYTLFWEYTTPYLSGVFFDNNEIHVWTKSRDEVRTPQDHEENFTQIMLDELVFWLNMNKEDIEKNYTIEVLDKFSLKLNPKKKSTFTSVVLLFNPDYKSLKMLTFYESNESYTQLNFENTKFNIDKNALFSYEKLFGKIK